MQYAVCSSMQNAKLTISNTKANANFALFYCLLLTAYCLLLPATAHGARIKDIVSIQGARYNQLIGYGLVVGLNGTGDKERTEFTVQSIVSMLRRMGITVDQAQVKIKNVAAVMLTANLPPFAKVGNRVDVLVSSLGDAKSLQGGTLLLAPLKGPDGEVYAVAQGPVSIGGGFAFAGAAAGIQKNHPTVGQVPNGALIEKEIPSDFNQEQVLNLTLQDSDFTTALRLAKTINNHLRGEFAYAKDSRTVELKTPSNFSGKLVELLASIEKLEISPDTKAKVVIDERTGTVVMGENVRTSTIAISHGNLTIQIKEQPRVSQPLPFAGGATVVVPESEVSVKEEDNRLLLVPSGVSIREVVKALNAIGATPRDLIAIFQVMKAAGALQAELEIY